MHSLGKARNRKKLTKLRKSNDEELRTTLILPPASANNESSSRHYAPEEAKPPLPPLPTGYKQMNYEETYEKAYEKGAASLAMTKHHLNSKQPKHPSSCHQPPIYPANETSLEHQNRLLYQRQLSKSVGDNLQQQSKPKFSTLDSKSRLLRPLSSGDLLGKTDEELILLLIQLKRNQSQLKHTIEKLTLQMQSEDKMSTIEPHKMAEHKLKYEQVKEQLIETQKQYENQFPLIDLIDNMVKFNSSSRSNLHNPIYGYNSAALSSHSGLTGNTANSLSTNNVYASSTNGKDAAARSSTSTSYLNHLGDQTGDRKKRMNDESDYAESDANNAESTYTNRTSTACAQQLSENQDLTVRDQSISNRNLEIPSTSYKQQHHGKRAPPATNSQTNKQSSEQTSSQATTNTLSSVIASVKQMHSNSNLQVNQPKHQQPINQAAAASGSSKSKIVLAEEEMQRMKEQQILLEAELERVRTLLLNSQLNVPQSNLDDLSIATTTENHFQAELEHIDNEINTLNAKKEKLIQSLKRKEHGSQNRERGGGYCSALRSKELRDLEDGTDLFTDDDAIFSTANSIDFERVLDDGLSLCTDVDDLELSKHENEYVQTLQAEHEQNLKQQEEERKKLELERLHQQAGDERKQMEQCKSTSSSNNGEDEGTTETTIYKTLRLVKRKYESSKLNKQLTFDSGDILRMDNKIIEVKRVGNEADKIEKEKHLSSADCQQSSKLKVGIFS